jgi:endonuclease III
LFLEESKRRFLWGSPRAGIMSSSKRNRMVKEQPDDEVATKRVRKSHSASEPETKACQGPFPDWSAPREHEVRSVHEALSTLHPEVMEEICKPKKDEGGCGSRELILDALVGTILSQNTTDVQSHRSFLALKQAFPTWEAVRSSPPAAIETVIRSCGLAETKTARIQAILERLHEERGECSLEHLRDEPDEEVKRVLGSFKGVGAKTISCVLMFCLKRADFPVDTHVWKIAMALGWVPKSASRDQTYAHLNNRVPDGIKYALHVLLVKHGKVFKNDVKALRTKMRGALVVQEELAMTRVKPEEVEGLLAVKPEPVD